MINIVLYFIIGMQIQAGTAYWIFFFIYSVVAVTKFVVYLLSED